jgi:hypothetical protein
LEDENARKGKHEKSRNSDCTFSLFSFLPFAIFRVLFYSGAVMSVTKWELLVTGNAFAVVMVVTPFCDVFICVPVRVFMLWYAVSAVPAAAIS